MLQQLSAAFVNVMTQNLIAISTTSHTSLHHHQQQQQQQLQHYNITVRHH